MIDPLRMPSLSVDELLARFIFSSKHIRNSDDTIKPGAFLPPKNLELSVMRHRSATESEIWEVGCAIAAERNQTLYGRGDATTRVYRARGLKADPAPTASNPNHAVITGWPPETAEQQLLALEIAAEARLVRHGRSP